MTSPPRLVAPPGASWRLSASLRTPSRPWGARLGSWSCRMCRLLGVVSREPIALDRAIAAEIEPFTAQSEVHKAGWGVAWFEQQRPHIARHLDVARESAAYREAIAAARGPMMLVHLRKASPGLPLQLSNTHPFREGERDRKSVV